jgi:predicted PurR-regulated permease PerM
VAADVGTDGATADAPRPFGRPGLQRRGIRRGGAYAIVTGGLVLVVYGGTAMTFGLAVATLAFFCAYQGLENWVVYPRVMSRAVKISNLAAIVAALLGGAVFGVLGVLLAVPVYASMQLLAREVLLPRQEAR